MKAASHTDFCLQRLHVQIEYAVQGTVNSFAQRDSIEVATVQYKFELKKSRF